MLIGVDLDNTIIRYDELFYNVAVDRGVIPSDLLPTKTAVRDYLRRENREHQWIDLQGWVYGVRIREAFPFPGVLDFFARCKTLGVEVVIVSNKTLRPYGGPRCDLQQAAHGWLEAHGFYDTAVTGLTRDRVHFEVTREEKLARIRSIGCRYFIDDQPEILSEAILPDGAEKILFDPNRQYPEERRFRRTTSWQEVEALILSGDPSVEIVRAKARELVSNAGFPPDYRLRSLSGGANNKVFQVEASNLRALLKVYFHHPDDGRDRLGAEFKFCAFAWDHGNRDVPRPLGWDLGHRLGLYEYVEGQPLKPGEVQDPHVRAALRFFLEINENRLRPAAEALPPASEACFRLGDHLETVEFRLRRLKGANSPWEVDREAKKFVLGELTDAWNRVRERVYQDASRAGLSLDRELDPLDRCLSPSDFGFHNAILQSDGRARFIDFEYAGWDDPAKMVCDFFLHPAVPVPVRMLPAFVGEVSALVQDPSLFVRRVGLLMPVYGIKWCCILLNDFLPVGSRRRRFAQEGGDENRRKVAQLEKARRLLHDLTKMSREGGGAVVVFPGLEPGGA